MAEIGNQLEGVGAGLDRFLEALDEAGYKLGSNAALVATQARAAKKMKDQDHFQGKGKDQVQDHFLKRAKIKMKKNEQTENEMRNNEQAENEMSKNQQAKKN